MGFGYTVGITLDPELAANYRGKGSFGWGGAAGTSSWADPENELVAVLMLQQEHGGISTFVRLKVLVRGDILVSWIDRTIPVFLGFWL
jgi:CubicO group peptidase (beta-lactamase class C family)